MILAAAIGGANSMTSEREDDTWISLVSTPLEDIDIVLPKMIGVLWKLRWGILLIAFEWMMGVICGGIHPLGVIFQAVELATFLTFATALGTYFSTTSKSSWRAQSTTIGVLMMCVGGYLACCCPLTLSGGHRSSVIYLIGCMPFIIAVSLAGPWEFSPQGQIQVTWTTGSASGETTLTCFLGTLLYGILAVVFTVLAIARFAKAADRPSRHQFAPKSPLQMKDKPTPEFS